MERRTRCTPRPVRTTALVALLALAAAACGGGDGDGGSTSPTTAAGATATGGIVENGRTPVDEGEPRTGGSMVIAVNAETDGWNPNGSRWADAGNLVGSSMLEPLLSFDADGVLVPHLAESVESDDTGTVWTITLRSDDDGEPFITFHDDTVLDSEALKINLEDAVDAQLTGLAQKEYAPTVEIVDDLTVRVTLTKPWRNWQVSLTGPAGIMRSPAMIASPDGGSNPVGTGPYEFERWIRDDALSVTAYEDYWGDGPYLDSMTFKVLVDPLARSDALASGDVDVIMTTSPDDIASFREDPEVQLIEDLRAEETFIMLNEAGPPFDDPLARRAVVLATDQAAINENIGAGITVPAEGPFAPGDRWYDGDTGWPEHDPAAAAEAVAAYEEATGGPLAFELTSVPDGDAVRLNQTLIDQWRQVGIEASLSTVEQTQYIVDTISGGYQAAWFRNYGYTDPDFDYIFWHSKQTTEPPAISINFTHMKDPVLDRLLDHVREEARTEEERKADYAEIVRTLNADLSHVWLFHTPAALVARLDVRGLNPARDRGGFGTFEPKPWIGGLWRAAS